MSLPSYLPPAIRFNFPDNGTWSIWYSGRDIGAQVAGHEPNTIVQLRGNANFTSGPGWNRDSMMLYKLQVDPTGVQILKTTEFYYPVSNDEGGFGSKARLIRTQTGFALLTPTGYYADFTRYTWGEFQDSFGGIPPVGGGYLIYPGGVSSGWWLVTFDADLNYLGKVTVGFNESFPAGQYYPGYPQPADLFCLPDGDLVIFATRQVGVLAGYTASAASHFERWSGDLSTRRWENHIASYTTGNGKWTSSGTLDLTINKMLVQYGDYGVDEQVLEVDLDTGAITSHLASTYSADDGYMLWQYHNLVNHDPDPGVTIPWKGGWAPTNGLTYPVRMGAYRHTMDIDTFVYLPYPYTGAGDYDASGKAWYDGVMAGWGMRGNTQFWARKSSHFPYYTYPTPTPPDGTAYLGMALLDDTGWTPVGEVDFLALLDPADADIKAALQISDYDSMGFFVSHTGPSVVVSLVNLGYGHPGWIGGNTMMVWVLPVAEAGLRLFQRADVRSVVNSPRMAKTETGNNPGSLQDNPAPRLRQTGNVHL